MMMDHAWNVRHVVAVKLVIEHVADAPHWVFVLLQIFMNVSPQ